MDNTASRIIEMDKKTVRLKENTKDVIKEKREKLEAELDALDLKYKEEGETEGEAIYNQIIAEGMETIKNSEMQTNKNLSNLENLYNNKKEALVEEIWKDLFI